MSIALFLVSTLLMSASALPTGYQNESGSKPAKATKELILLTCFTEEQRAMDFECGMKSIEWIKQNGKQNSTDCKKSADPEMCRAIQTSVIKDIGSKCWFTKLNAFNEATGQIDYVAFRNGLLGPTSLSAPQKTAAMATFDACVAANYTMPYSPIQFNSQNNPERLRDFVTKFNRVNRFGQLAPSITTFSGDCMTSALLQNGCAQVSEADLVEITKGLESTDVPDWSQVKMA